MSTNTFPPGDPVPAVPEAAASGRVAAIFAELREATGMPIVNLVWRHLATEPGALEWTWAALGPLYRSGAVLGEAMHLHERMVLPAVAPWPRAALRAAGIDAGAEATIAAVLASYDRGNSVNLLAFTALLAHLDGRPAASSPRIAGPPSPGRALPPLVDLERADPFAADLALRLNRLGQPAQGPILASLYRHLAHWPGYLALAWTLLEPLDRRGELAAAVAATRAAAAAGAGALLPAIPAVPATAADRAFARGALELFLGHGIARMTTIGRILMSAQPD
jgi:hypothetical protein